jgi:hypothetical protein
MERAYVREVEPPAEDVFDPCERSGRSDLRFSKRIERGINAH